MKHNFFGWLAAATLLLTTACAGVADLDGAQTTSNTPNVVTFMVQSQYQTNGMRGIETGNTTISKGEKADLLLFTVYEVTKNADGTETYTPATKFKKEESEVTDFERGEGQNAIHVDKYPVKLQFVVDDDKKYKVAFWAQSSKTKAYDAKDLQAVKVNYTDATGNNFENNDELRDAFCAISEPFDADTKTMQTVKLHRPLAQINVGTVGWDYEGAAYLKPSKTSYIRSTMTLKGVADTYNVLTKEAGQAISGDVTFDYDILPAFINVKGTEGWKTNLKYTPFANEEYLKIHLYTDSKSDYNPYVGWDEFDDYRKDKTKEADNSDSKSTKELYEAGIYPETETFKYLSMCYVLVPDKTTAGQSNEYETGSTLNSVKFQFKGVTAADDVEIFNPEDTETSPTKEIEVTNVPVQKNWRTNILGNGFFTFDQNYKLDVVPKWAGDYNDNGTIEGSLSATEHLEESHTYNLTLQRGEKIDNTQYAKADRNDNGFFTCISIQEGVSDEKKYKGQYDDLTFTYAGKMGGSSQITFETKTSATVYIFLSASSELTSSGRDLAHIKLDNVDYGPESAEATTSGDGISKIRIYTITGVPAGNHTISRGDTWDASPQNAEQGFLFGVKVVTNEEMVKDNEDRYTEQEDAEFKGTYGGDSYNYYPSTGNN